MVSDDVSGLLRVVCFRFTPIVISTLLGIHPLNNTFHTYSRVIGLFQRACNPEAIGGGRA